MAALASLPNDAFSALLARIGEGLRADDAAAAAEQVEGRSAAGSQPGLAAIISAAASMQDYYEGAEASPATFGKEISQALATDAPTLAQQVDAQTIAERVSQIVAGKRIELLDDKVRSLRFEVERSYCCSRVLTDARTVFGADPSVPPTAATILHTLRIGYIDDAGKHKEFYLGLEGGELGDLKEQLERAISKGATLGGVLAKVGIRVIE